MTGWDRKSFEVDLDEASIEAMENVAELFRSKLTLELEPTQVGNMLIGMGARAFVERFNGATSSGVEVLPPGETPPARPVTRRAPRGPRAPRTKTKRKGSKRKASKRGKRKASKSSPAPGPASPSGSLCACGCGLPAAKGRAYKWGHKLAGESAAAPSRGARRKSSSSSSSEDSERVVFDGGEGLTTMTERHPDRGGL